MKTILAGLFTVLALASLLVVTIGAENMTLPSNSENSAPSDFVRRQGNQLVVGANDQPVRLRGVNLSADRLEPVGGGDWFIGTCQELASNTSTNPVTNWYQEKHFQSIADIGFNTIRVNPHYRIFEDDASPGVYKESGWDFLDHYVQWANNHGLYLILDLHVPPGGLQPTGGGGACLWDDGSNQTRLVNLWRAIAQRYANEPAIAAYDLLNEPTPTPSGEPTQGAEKWQALAQQIVDAIRQVDQNHLIIVERVNWIMAANGTSPLADWSLPLLSSFQVSVNDGNTMYDFHSYDPMEYTLQNEGSVPDDGNYPDENETQTAKDGTAWLRNKNYLDHELTLETWDDGPMFVGEWGPNYSTFNEVKGGFTYIRDLFDLLDQHNLHWAYYSMFNLYQVSCCDTGVVCCSGDNATTPNTELVNLFTELFSTPPPMATSTPTPTGTPTPTPDASLTTIEIRDEVRVPDVKRLGINVGSHSQWGAAQILKNVIANPGFEAGVYGMVAHAAAGSTGTRFEQDFWDTSWNNDTWGIGQPEDFWNGADYEFVYGPAKGRAGTVTDFAHENNHYTYYLSQSGTAPEQWDVMLLRQQLEGTLAGAPGRWDARSADPTESRPGSPGEQSMHLTSPTDSWMAPYEFYMDSLWRDGDRDAGKLLLVEGNWHLEFWAKGNIDGAQLGAQFLREGEADFIDETISLTTDWQKYEFDVFVPQGTDSPGPYGDEDYHPILGLLFRVPNSGHEAWVDDVTLYHSDYTNPTAFTDSFVNRLKELNPGILRDWRNMFGDTLDLQLAEPWARSTQGWRPDEREAGEYGYSLHEFLELCQEVGTEPWYVIAPTFSPEDLVNLVEYLAGPADGAHLYADQRAALGQSGPWTDVFPIIHLEFGNELWGSASGGDPFFGASLLGGVRLGAIAHDRFGILQSSPYYDSANFNLIIGGQAGWPDQQTNIEGNSSNHDSIALAPYFGILDQWDDDATIYYPLFATPFDWANTGRMGQSKANIDSFGQGTELAIYEINFHTTSGEAPLDVRNDYVTGLDSGIALPLHMLVYMRDLGIVNQTAYTALGFATNFSTNPGEWVRLWGMLRDLEATGRKRPTWLGMELANKAIQGDMLQTVQGGTNPSWVQTAINGVETGIEVNYVQSFAFRDGDSYSVILFNLSLDQPQPVRLDLPAQPNSQATRYELTSASIHEDNEDAENVSIQTTQLTSFADQYDLTLPPHSVNVITWNTQSAPPTTTATPTSTSTPTATPTSTSTPTATATTPTSTPDPSLTTIEIQNQTSVSQVKPFGIVLGWRDRWGAGPFVKNIIENPGFEAGLFRSIIHADNGASGIRVPQAFWDTTWNDDQSGVGQPQGFWNGAEYEVIYGPAKGRTGTVTNFTHENNQNVFYLDSDGVAPEQYDAIVVRAELPGINAWGYAYSADTSTVRPGSPGSQSLRLGYPAEPWQEAYAFYMDAAWRDGDPSSGKLMIVQGDWHLEFWARGGSDGDQLRVRFFREDEADFIDETISLTTGWQKIERDVFIPAGADAVRAYTNEEYHPLLGFAFYIPAAGDEAWVDDVALYRSGDTNPTVFTDRLVDRLKELGPGILRDWDDHQMGNSLDNELTVPWARKTVNYNPSERAPYLFPYSLHEFLELCQEIGAEPWHVVPPASSPAELINLLEYLAGPADGSHPYADRRAALGQSIPWTDVFPMIHLEFGNELWGTAQADDPYFGASLMNGVRLGQIAHDRFEILKSSPYYNATKFNTIIGGQAGWTPRQQEIEGNSSNHDTISLAPYFQFSLDRYGSDEEIFYPAFAQPFDNVTSGIMRESKDYIDGFGQGTGLAVYELNFHTTLGDVPIEIRNDLVTGMGGIALPLHMLVYLRDMGITEQAAFGVHGYSTRWMMESSGYTRLWGMLRDLEATGRKRPTWLGVEIVNKAVQGDLLTTVQSGANPGWHQMPFNGVLNEIDVSYVQSFAFRDGDSFGVILFNLSLDESQPVRLDLPTQPQSQATRYELASASIHDDNEDAENISIQTTQLTDFADQYELTLPPHSVNVITWNAAACYDFDGSGEVDIVDIMLVASRWHTAEGDEDYDPLYDLDDNGEIDIVDIMLVAVHWGETC